MATTENGLPGNISGNFFSPVNIASSTNANPIVVTTSTAHGLTNGDVVTISGHAGNVAANNTWTATVLTSTTFSIPATGTGVGTTSGTVQSLAIGPTFQIPSDGVDNLAAASVNVPFNALADRTAFLGAATGGLKVVSLLNAYHSDLTLASYDSITVSSTATWFQPATVWIPTAIGAPGAQMENNAYPDMAFVEISMNISTLATGGTAALGELTLFSFVNPPGGATVSWSFINGTSQVFQAAVGTTNYYPIRLSGFVPTRTVSGTLQLQAQARTTVGTCVINFVGDYAVNVIQFRSTGMPQ